jgi:hypothetical protein
VNSEAEGYVTVARPISQELLAGIRQSTTKGVTKISFEALPGRIRIVAAASSAMAAMTAVTMTALALIEAVKDDGAAIEAVRRLAPGKTAQREFRSAGSLSKEPVAARGRVRPEVLMSETSSPRVLPEEKREAFRRFMTGRRLRPTEWAREAGVSAGEILGFLTGRSRSFSEGVAEKLARAAKVSVEEMFH